MITKKPYADKFIMWDINQAVYIALLLMAIILRQLVHIQAVSACRSTHFTHC